MTDTIQGHYRTDDCTRQEAPPAARNFLSSPSSWPRWFKLFLEVTLTATPFVIAASHAAPMERARKAQWIRLEEAREALSDAQAESGWERVP